MGARGAIAGRRGDGAVLHRERDKRADGRPAQDALRRDQRWTARSARAERMPARLARLGERVGAVRPREHEEAPRLELARRATARRETTPNGSLK